MRIGMTLFCFFALICVHHSYAEFTNTTDPVPIDRLIQNLSTYIQNNPDDAHGYYTLGRVHRLAFAAQQEVRMRFFQNEEKTTPLDPPRFAPWDSLFEANPKTIYLSNEQKEHFFQSLENYHTATTLNPNMLGKSKPSKKRSKAPTKAGLLPRLSSHFNRHSQSTN